MRGQKSHWIKRDKLQDVYELRQAQSQPSTKEGNMKIKAEIKGIVEDHEEDRWESKSQGESNEELTSDK